MNGNLFRNEMSRLLMIVWRMNGFPSNRTGQSTRGREIEGEQKNVFDDERRK